MWNTFFRQVFYVNHGTKAVLIPHKRSFLKKIPHPAILFPYRFPEFKTNKQGTLYSLVWKVTILNTHPVDSHLQLKRMISGIYNIQAKTSRIPCLNFGEFRFQGSFRILFPVKIFCVFPKYWIPYCSSVELGFQIPIVSAGFWISWAAVRTNQQLN